jgi:hypothetical protein
MSMLVALFEFMVDVRYSRAVVSNVVSPKVRFLDSLENLSASITGW